MAPAQAKLLEHNVRFGDPECQSLMVRLRSDLLESLLAQRRGEDVSLDWSPDPSLTVVLAAKGYPGSYAKGGPIRGLQGVTGAKVFHAGTALKDGEVVAAGARRAGRRAGCCCCCHRTAVLLPVLPAACCPSPTGLR